MIQLHPNCIDSQIESCNASYKILNRDPELIPNLSESLHFLGRCIYFSVGDYVFFLDASEEKRSTLKTIAMKILTSVCEWLTTHTNINISQHCKMIVGGISTPIYLSDKHKALTNVNVKI